MSGSKRKRKKLDRETEKGERKNSQARHDANVYRKRKKRREEVNCGKQLSSPIMCKRRKERKKGKVKDREREERRARKKEGKEGIKGGGGELANSSL